MLLPALLMVTLLLCVHVPNGLLLECSLVSAQAVGGLPSAAAPCASSTRVVRYRWEILIAACICGLSTSARLPNHA